MASDHACGRARPQLPGLFRAGKGAQVLQVGGDPSVLVSDRTSDERGLIFIFRSCTGVLHSAQEHKDGAGGRRGYVRARPSQLRAQGQAVESLRAKHSDAAREVLRQRRVARPLCLTSSPLGGWLISPQAFFVFGGARSRMAIDSRIPTVRGRRIGHAWPGRSCVIFCGFSCLRSDVGSFIALPSPVYSHCPYIAVAFI